MHPIEVLAHEASTGEIIRIADLGDVLDEVAHLRCGLGLCRDLRTDLLYLLALHDQRHRRPLVVLLRKNGELQAAMVLAELVYLGIHSGVYVLGDSVGDCALVGDMERAGCHISTAACVIFRTHLAAHMIRICMPPSGVGAPMPPTKGITVLGQRRSICRRLELAPTFSQMLQGFGAGTRRQLKQKRIRLELHAGARFFASMSPDEALTVMNTLSAHSFPHRLHRDCYRRYELLKNERHAFAMGLHCQQAGWISILSGWRIGKCSYVDLQMNDERYPKASVSAVMRSYLLEHEISLGQTGIVFVGGVSRLLGRYCVQDEECLDLVYRRRNVIGPFARMVMRLFASDGLREHFFWTSADEKKSGAVQSCAPLLSRPILRMWSTVRRSLGSWGQREARPRELPVQSGNDCEWGLSSRSE